VRVGGDVGKVHSGANRRGREKRRGWNEAGEANPRRSEQELFVVRGGQQEFGVKRWTLSAESAGGARDLKRGSLVDGVPDRDAVRARPGDESESLVEALKSMRGVPTDLATKTKGPPRKPAKVSPRG